MTEIERARQALLDVEVNPGTEEIAVEEAWGRVLAERVTAGPMTATPSGGRISGRRLRRRRLL